MYCRDNYFQIENIYIKIFSALLLFVLQCSETKDIMWFKQVLSLQQDKRVMFNIFKLILSVR